MLLSRCKIRSKHKNIKFNLDKDWLLVKLKKGRCEVTGIKFKYRKYDCKATSNFFAPSVDRIDSNKGYTKSNCRLVLWGFNRAKGDNTDKDLYKLCKYVHENLECKYDNV